MNWCPIPDEGSPGQNTDVKRKRKVHKRTTRTVTRPAPPITRHVRPISKPKAKIITQRELPEKPMSGEEEESVSSYVLAVISFLLGAGPILCVTIQQVCVTKCLLMRRLPRMGSDMDDILIIVLFVFFVAVNYILCCLTWLFFRRGLRMLYLRFVHGHPYVPTMPKCVEQWLLMDPKITRSGCVYGYRQAKYVPDTSLEGARKF